MAQAVSAIVARSSEYDETLAKAFDVRRERIAEMARERTDPNMARLSQPAPAVKVDTARPVAAVAAASGGQPSMSRQVRSMLAEPPQSAQNSGSRSSTMLIGQLLDALRQYERAN